MVSAIETKYESFSNLQNIGDIDAKKVHRYQKTPLVHKDSLNSIESERNTTAFTTGFRNRSLCGIKGLM